MKICTRLIVKRAMSDRIDLSLTLQRGLIDDETNDSMPFVHVSSNISGILECVADPK